jgi:hypothetical protein
MRRISKTVGSALAALCLVSTLTMAQSQSSHPPIAQGQNPAMNQERVQNPAPTQYPSQPMTPQTGNTTPQQGHRQNPSEERTMTLVCSRDDGKGDCVAAKGTDGKEFVVVGEGLKSGATMSCVDRGNMVHCKPAS